MMILQRFKCVEGPALSQRRIFTAEDELLRLGEKLNLTNAAMACL